MGRTTVTFDIPDAVYDNLRQIAEQRQISPEAVLSEWVDTLWGEPSDIPDEAALSTYGDEQLWAVVSRIWRGAARLRELSDQAKHEALSPEEQAELDQLVTQYDTWVLVRSTALALLQKRGYDIKRYLQSTA